MAETGHVAVTGASGLIGRALVERLGQEPGLVPLPLARSQGAPDLDTAPDAAWRQALGSARTCVHLAARLPWGSDNDRAGAHAGFLATNVEGTARLFRAFAAGGGRHFVFLSTIGINGTVSGARPFRESDPPSPRGNYAISKLRAEQMLQAAAAESGVALTVVRAPLVYGPDCSGPFAALVARVRRGGVLPLGGIDNHRDLIGLGNLVDLLATLVRAPASGTFLVRDRDPVSTTRIVELIAAAYGVRPRLARVPAPLGALALHLPVVGPIAARLLGDVRIDDSALARALAWRPPRRVADEIAVMAQQTA